MPPATSSASSTMMRALVRLARRYAAVNPAGPAPMMTTRSPGASCAMERILTGATGYATLILATARCPARSTAVRATIIVPFHRNTVHLRACLSALRQSGPELELIVAADGAVED